MFIFRFTVDYPKQARIITLITIDAKCLHDDLQNVIFNFASKMYFMNKNIQPR